MSSSTIESAVVHPYAETERSAVPQYTKQELRRIVRANLGTPAQQIAEEIRYAIEGIRLGHRTTRWLGSASDEDDRRLPWWRIVENHLWW